MGAGGGGEGTPGMPANSAGMAPRSGAFGGNGVYTAEGVNPRILHKPLWPQTLTEVHACVQIDGM